MRKFIGLAAALATALPLATFATATTADAGPGRHAHGGGHKSHGFKRGGRHHAHGYKRGHRHHGRGYYRNGKWIALGVGAAIAGAAAADYYGDCYWRNGYRYCD